MAANRAEQSPVKRGDTRGGFYATFREGIAESIFDALLDTAKCILHAKTRHVTGLLPHK
jgi:hypothetical protein